MRLKDRPRWAKAKIDRAVPIILISVATKVCLTERFALGNKVTTYRQNVPVMAITRGRIPSAFLMGSILIRNKIDINPRKQVVESFAIMTAASLHGSP